jgi:hypothetical protein
MKRYILDAPLTPPKDTSDAPARLLAFVKACKEMIADGKITPEEAEALRRWLSAAGWLKHFWPANAIAVRINRLLEPVPTEQQLQDLGTFLSQIVQQSNFDESHEQEELLDDPELLNDPELQQFRASRELFDDPVPEIVFPGRTFCLTGIFYYGWRADCEDAIKERGGVIRHAMSGSTNYLVVGGICNPQWRRPDSGTKIDSAVAFRSENRQWNIDLPRHPRIVPAIIRERDWVAAFIGT